MNLLNGSGDVLRLFSDISNSNKKHIVNNNLGGLWKEKVVEYTKLQAFKATESSTLKPDAMCPSTEPLTTNKPH